MEFNGTFLWNELMTPDLEATKAFYASVAGWTYTEMPAPEGSVYTIANVPSQPRGVAGIMQSAEGEPSFNTWMPYLGVADIEAAVENVVAGGGTIVRPVFEIPGTGHIAILKDATGAMVGLLQPAPM